MTPYDTLCKVVGGGADVREAEQLLVAELVAVRDVPLVAVRPAELGEGVVVARGGM